MAAATHHRPDPAEVIHLREAATRRPTRLILPTGTDGRLSPEWRGYLAGWWTRVGATIIDGLIIGVVTGIIVFSAGGSNRGFDLTDWALLFIYSFILLGVPRSQTVGMIALGTRVLDANTGEPIGFARSFGRALVYFLLGVTIIGGVIDILWPLWDGRNQTLHDKAIGSVLVRIR